MLCENCNNNEAVVRVIEINEDEALEKQLCENCALRLHWITHPVFRQQADDIKKLEHSLSKNEVNIFKEISAGDDKARQKFLEDNLCLVISVAKNYKNQGLSFPDLIHAGNAGLEKAVSKYKLDSGHRFSTYATWWIRQAITRAIGNR